MELKTEILGEDLHSARVDYKKKKKWYLQSYLIGIPEICIGYRDTNFILRKMERVPLDQLYSPPSGTLQDAYAFANRILESLRNFCSSPGYGSSSGVWKVTVQRGMLLEQPQMV
ncbi:hypothetical protein BDY19DRAFT_924054 [Irpex rosettiformis]|uniref:Uncharacterized protein n=1 Tax=Irpex rosettiformis TaxID=378272 RepID=A0ACB8UFE8_9APHY|nr:hypothetical protein BDY19DRAFT_924054 [Irpex rosettiformis]